MNDVFDTHANTTDTIQIDRLTIELDTNTANGSVAEIGRLFEQEFEKAFLSILSQQSARIPRGQEYIERELLEYFLRTGTLPWWASDDPLDLQEIGQRVLTHEQSRIRAFLYEHRRDAHVWQRIAFQFRPNVTKLIIALIDELASAEAIVMNWFERIKARSGQTVAVGANEILSSLLLANAPAIIEARGHESIVVPIFERRIIEMLGGDVELFRYALVTPLDPAMPEPDRREAKERQRKVVSASLEWFKDHVDQEVEAAPAPSLGPNASGMADAILNASGDLQVEQEHMKEQYVVSSAGLVLLSPFLRSFFANIELTQNHAWVSTSAQQRGVLLLNYLATGQLEAPEYELVLAKLLAGVPIAETLPHAFEPTDKEVEEAEALLTSVVEHWSILKNTSIDGLRETFIRRPGILRRDQSNWHLFVERMTLDVLLDKLPWSYSMVAIPWNRYVITVDW